MKSAARQTELREPYRARAIFLWQKVRDPRFKNWHKLARSAAWRNLLWDWNALGISEAARKAARTLEFVPSEIFAHPDVISTNPDIIDYYRLLSGLPKKRLARVGPGAAADDEATLCRLLNASLSPLLVMAVRTGQAAFLKAVFAEACSELRDACADSLTFELDERRSNNLLPELSF